jgi:hypothetical protein
MRPVGLLPGVGLWGRGGGGGPARPGHRRHPGGGMRARQLAPPAVLRRLAVQIVEADVAVGGEVGGQHGGELQAVAAATAEPHTATRTGRPGASLDILFHRPSFPLTSLFCRFYFLKALLFGPVLSLVMFFFFRLAWPESGWCHDGQMFACLGAVGEGREPTADRLGPLPSRELFPRPTRGWRGQRRNCTSCESEQKGRRLQPVRRAGSRHFGKQLLAVRCGAPPGPDQLLFRLPTHGRLFCICPPACETRPTPRPGLHCARECRAGWACRPGAASTAHQGSVTPPRVGPGPRPPGPLLLSLCPRAALHAGRPPPHGAPGPRQVGGEKGA